ncbi:Allophanate hydrolase subunit 2 [Amphibacillus marinus]|uniref:Allophanate hydrolase subunit 2 n=1 Tax=Amphibacillus marinus TaxID=872970 RepID=A0A1H8KAA5_9BACI|nr:biotin-dependent carboxyltransferase family protein [Amphibacillus marinus]SEN89631.1 Allophanate hydrolase subunit 2 [Amphibacillus marinus]
MGLKVIKSGVHITVQDFGRIAHQHLGFSVAGAMDRQALELANRLVQNTIDEACLEIMLTGGTFLFTKSTVIAITGADCQPKLNDVSIAMYESIIIRAGDELAIGYLVDGRFSYLSVQGGFVLDAVLGSRSTSIRYQLGGYQGRALQPGDQLQIRESGQDGSLPELTCKHDTLNKDHPLRVRYLASADLDYFSIGKLADFEQMSFHISAQADRMGYRLIAPNDRLAHEHTMISEATVCGAIQIPPNGHPIVLLMDRQTTGGYPVIGVVASVDLPKLVQCSERVPINFTRITVEEAQLLIEEQAQLNQSAIKPKAGLACVDQVKQLIEVVEGAQLSAFTYQDKKGVRIKLSMRNVKGARNYDKKS